MRSHMTILGCLALILVAGAALGADKKPATQEKFNVIGIVQTGVAAIGGETTGTILKTDTDTFELEVAGDLAKKAKELDGHYVRVTGVLNVRAGVEIKERRIVTVETLEAVMDK